MSPSLLLQVHQHVLLQLMLSATRHKPKHELWQPRHSVWRVQFPDIVCHNERSQSGGCMPKDCRSMPAPCETIVAMCCVNMQVQLVKDDVNMQVQLVKDDAHIASPVVDGYGVVMPVQPVDERLDGRLIQMA